MDLIFFTKPSVALFGNLRNDKPGGYSGRWGGLVKYFVFLEQKLDFQSEDMDGIEA